MITLMMVMMRLPSSPADVGEMSGGSERGRKDNKEEMTKAV